MNIEAILKHDMLLYVISLLIGFGGVFMCLIFLPFKSVATLMMMMSGIGMVFFAAFVLLIAVLLDIKNGKFMI
ncbi:MAG: hypothetical protein KAH86_00750 [Methanosarcinales archaeon]|nr:hypothetical protein [Methanosarcinales archaeon]